MPAAFDSSVVDVGGEWILGGKRTAWNKAQTGHSAFRTEVASDPAQGLCRRLNPRDDHMPTHAPPDFPRGDATGAEVQVFRRAQRLLREKRPGILCGMPSEEKQRARLEGFLPFAYTCQPCGTNHLPALPQ